MIPRPLFAVLLFTLPILTVIFLVVSGGFLLLSASSDGAGAAVLRWVGIGLLILIVADVVLLVGAIGLNQYLERRPPPDSRS